MKNKNTYQNWTREDLIKEINRIKSTTYGLVWHRDVPKEKIDAIINPDTNTPDEIFTNQIAGKPFPVLKEIKKREIIADKTKPVNLLIEGDNYHSLAALNFTHQAAVDLIYIDPPYNTGDKNFIYNDSFVDREDPYRHSKWLSFMEKRLVLARNLLKKDGVIFVSIDDNELAQLKMLADRIFGERNFIEIFSWMKTETPSNLSNKTKKKLEYILCYEKERNNSRYVGLNRQNHSSNSLLNQNNSIKVLKFPKNLVQTRIPDGIVKMGKYGTKKYLVELLNDVVVDKGIFANDFSLRAKFRWSQQKLNEEIKKGTRILIPTTKISPAYEKSEYDPETPSNFISDEEGVGTNEDASRELQRLFSGKKVFDYPKPVSLIKYLLGAINKKNALILDFMAGSGTTGQAVLELNKEDGGNRQFILCTNNENDICVKVCYPRVEKIIKGYKNSDDKKVEGLSSNLKYYVCDFVEAESTDRNKRKLVNKSTEMLCIKEKTFEFVQGSDNFKIFKNHNKYLGIVFHEDAIDNFKKTIRKIKGHFNIYVFSLGDDSYENRFVDVKDKVTLGAIPEVILKVYREIFK